MVHVVMQIDNIGEEAAIDKVRGAVKDEFKSRCFKPVKDIDEYTDMKKLKKSRDEGNLPVRATLLLRAGVVAIQCCCQKRMKTAEVKTAFGNTAYGSAKKLKEKLGLPGGRH